MPIDPPSRPDDPTEDLGAGPRRAAPRSGPSAIGRYAVEGRLGAGGMGAVYRARDSSLGRPVAVKVLLAAPDDARARARMTLEARAAARLRHPGIVTVYEAGEHAGAPYLVMELVEGRTLARVLRDEGALPPRRAASVLREVALALEHAHRAGVVHRDVKPENIFIEPDGRVRLGDFGLALDASSTDRLTRSGELLGTLRYMAPEQASGERAEIGPPADVWAIGATLHGALAGAPAFDGEGPMAIVRAIIMSPPPSLRERAPGTPPELERIVDRCLQKEPAARPTAGEVAEELARFLAPAAASGEPPAVGRAPGPDRRTGAAGWLGRVALLAAGAAIATLVAVSLRAGGRAPPAVVEEAAPPGPTASPQATDQTPAPTAPEATPSESVDDVDAILERVNARLVGGDLLKAERDLQRAVELAPDRGDVWYALATVRLNQRDHEAALAAADRAVALDPGRIDTWVRRAEVHLALGHDREALADAEKAVEVEPRSSVALHARAKARRRIGDAPGALADIEAALSEDASNAAAFLTRGIWRQEAGDRDGALADLRRSLELEPDEAAGWTRLAVAQTQDGALLEAVASYDRAIALGARSAEVYYGRGFAQLSRGAPREAAADFDAALERAPEMTVALTMRATARWQSGDLDGAIADAERAIEQPGPPNAAVHLALGISRWLRGEPERARPALERAARLGYDFAWVLLHAAGGDARAGLEATAARGGRASAVARLFLGQASVDHLLASAAIVEDASERVRLIAEAHAYAGLLGEMRAERDAARAHYERCVQARRLTDLEHWWVRRRLAALAAGD